MDTAVYLSFIIISVGVIVSPGPNVLLVVSTSLSHGKNKGLQTSIGVMLAMAVQLVVAATSTAWLITMLNTGFIWIKWMGVIYLLYLGFSQLRLAFSDNNKIKPPTALGSFSRGFFVSLTNPKTLFFLGAFLPQFASSQYAYLPQIILLSVSFWVIALLTNIFYSLLAGKISTLFRSKKFVKTQNWFSGLLYMCAGIALAVSNRS